MSWFNAWHEAWVPICRVDGSEETLSIRDTFLEAHEIAGLGGSLTPLDRDSMYRFLLSLGALVAREMKLTDQGGALFPSYAVDSVGSKYEARFELSGDRPFMQRWDRTADDIAALRDPKKGLEGVLSPIEALHPHVPGASSSKWAIRRDDRSAGEAQTLAVLLVTAWFQTKNGNGLDAWKNAMPKGSAGTWHVNPMAVFLTDPESLARTILANIPVPWVMREDIPLYLDHAAIPDDFADAPLKSVTRFTYAKSLPLVFLEDGKPLGFVIGADSTIAVPMLESDEKTSLGVIHDGDQTRLYQVIRKARSTDETLKPRGSFGARISTTEGFERWFRAENGVAESLERWLTIARLHNVTDSERPQWRISVLSESTDGKGTRTWVAWDEVALAFGGVAGTALSSIQTFFEFVSDCRRQFYVHGRDALGSGGSTRAKDAPGFEVGQAAFYAAVMPTIADLQAELLAEGEPEMREFAVRVEHLAVAQFDAMTEPFLTPAKVPDIARARAGFKRGVRGRLNKAYPSSSETPAIVVASKEES